MVHFGALLVASLLPSGISPSLRGSGDNRAAFLFGSPLGGLAPSAGGHIVKAEVVWAAVARLRLVVFGCQLSCLGAGGLHVA